MFGMKRCPEQFEKSLDKLIAIKGEFDYIYASHDLFMLSNDYVEKVKMAWEQVQNGEVSYEMIDLFGNTVKSFTTPICGFYIQ